MDLGSSIKEMILNNILDDWTEIPVLLLETILILSKELLKIIKEHSIENRVFRMTLTVDPCQGSRDDSRNGPGSKKSLKDLIRLGCFNHKSDCLSKDVIGC
jgi:hypothetical protein